MTTDTGSRTTACGTPEAEAVPADALRDALGRFATGVTVVGARGADGAPLASTANAFTSVSLDPPLVLVCLKDASETLAAALADGHLTISVLAADQRDLAERFARRAAAGDWDGVPHAPGRSGAPLLHGALATLDCAVHDVADGGDHRIVVARVLAIEHPREDGAPLLFHRGAFAHLGEAADARAGGAASADAGAAGRLGAGAASAGAVGAGPVGAGPASAGAGESGPLGAGETSRGTPAGRAAATDGAGHADERHAPPPAAAELPTGLGHLRAVGVETGRADLAAMLAVLGEPAGVAGVRVHVHRGCVLGDALGHTGCATRAALDEALDAMRDDGAGVVAYVRDDRNPFAGCCVGPPAGPPLPLGARRALAGPLAGLGLADVRLSLSSPQLGEPAAVARRLGLRLTG